MSRLIRLGTRGSQLALIQAYSVRDKLARHFPECTVVVVPISTKGDTDKKTPLNQLGGKGVFIKELEHALLENRIDIAVHSLKDVTTDLHSDLMLSGFLSPEAFTDSLVTSSGATLHQLPPGAVIGTGSMRRVALLRRLRPDLAIVPIRGNVETRLAMCHGGDVDGIILSTAGLYRLNLQSHISEELPPVQFTPAPGQGVIALECRVDDVQSLSDSEAISDSTQTEISKFEYSIINRLQLHCGYPYGSYTRKEMMQWVVDIFFMSSSDASSVFFKTFTAPASKLSELSEDICSALIEYRRSDDT